MKKIIIGNLKMNLLSPLERERYFEAFKKEIKGKKLKESEIVLCPPAVHLESFVKNLKSKAANIGAQNIFWENKGSFTGEISAAMVKNLGGEYVILGHSERRKYFAESNREINSKMIAALKNGLKPVLCVGETKEERENHETLKIISAQVKESMMDISRAKAENIIIAYEPVWAVGSDIVPSVNEIMGAKVLIRKILVDLFGKKYAEVVRIIYGGSVSAKTAKQVCSDPGMDGALIGRESLTPREFIKIVEIIDKTDL